ncbi:MAG: SGNH/GDSL hydrolase family protein [Pseudomonadota bacterium]|nr:MAG: SGNH/GDSL hydrolase family protein [Pseudomonadota bacterium]
MSARSIACCILLLLLTWPLSAGAGESFSRLYVFGDSLSDTGNLAAVTGGFPDPPFFEGSRVSNGPVGVETLADGLGLEALPSLHLLMPATGTNYAVAGANAAGTEPIDLPVQLTLFLANHGGVAPPDALYVVFIGGNDVRAARDAANFLEAWKTLSAGVVAQAGTIRALAAAGARNFLVVNSPDIGLIPETSELALERGELRLRQRATAYSWLYNAMLARRVAHIEGGLEVDIEEFDLFRIFRELIGNPETYGFTNAQDACLGPGLVPRPDCDFDRFVFFDNIHPTARVHEILGRAALAGIAEGTLEVAAPTVAGTR